MHFACIVGVSRGRKWRTTAPDPSAPPAPDLVRRDSTATAPNPALDRRLHLRADRSGTPVPVHGGRCLLKEGGRLVDA